jgi:LysR family nitrogen assimilation transcriptional regulator
MPNSLRKMLEHELSRHDLRPHVRVEANTLPLMTDLVAQGLGYTLLPSCSVLALVNSGALSASPVAGLRITWTIARPSNRSLSAAAQMLLGFIFDAVDELIASGVWPLAEANTNTGRSLRPLSKPARISILKSKAQVSARRKRKVRKNS